MYGTRKVEAERIMAQLESGAAREDAVQDDGSPKYMPSTADTDPIVRALKTVLKCNEVTGAGRGRGAGGGERSWFACRRLLDD